MDNTSIITAIYAERRFCWHMLNRITNMSKREQGITPELKNLICEAQKEMDALYLEASDAYYESLLMNKEDTEYECRR